MVEQKLLDSRKPLFYHRIIDVLNNCFGEEFLGKTYKRWQMGSFPFICAGIEYSIWFPKLSVDGKTASKSRWINTISSDSKTIEEYGGKKRFDPSNKIIFVFAKKATEPYCFIGVFKVDTNRSTENHYYYYKIADIADLRSNVPLIHGAEDEEQLDEKLVSDLRKDEVFVPVDGFEYQGKPLPVPKPQHIQGRIVYPRDPQTALNALAHAEYTCEIDSMHPTFIRKKTGKPYTEPHHLIPMSMQEHFSVSLDVEENIVSLCSNCHNHIHYGRGSEKLLKALYKKRKKALHSVGIDVTEKQLLSFYK